MPEGFKETFVTVVECEECSHGIILFLSQETSKYSYFFLFKEKSLTVEKTGEKL